MPSRYSTPAVRRNLQSRITNMEECKRTPQAWEKIQDKAQFNKDLESTRTRLEASTPPEVTGDEKSKIASRVRMLETAIVQGKQDVVPPMPTEYQEWKVPAGTVGQKIYHEQYWKTHTLDAEGHPIPVDNKKGGRGGIFELKDLKRILHRDIEEYDPDVANLARIQPSGVAAPLADTRLPRSYGLTPAARDNYDTAFPDHAPTPVEAKLAGGDEVATPPVQPPPQPRKRRPRTFSADTPICEALTAKGTRCTQPCVAGTNHCFSKYHAEQLAPKVEGVKSTE